MAVSKNVYINKLDKIVDKYTKTYHRKKKSADVKPSMHIEYMILILSLLIKVVNWKLETVWEWDYKNYFCEELSHKLIGRRLSDQKTRKHYIAGII